MNIRVADLANKLALAAQKVVSEEEAEYFANESIETHIRKSPRSNPLKSTIGDLKACLDNSDKEISYKVDLPSFFSIDFHSHGPLVYINRIHDELEERANRNGLAMAAFTNSQSMHTLHAWVQGLAKRGLLVIAVCNGGPNAVAPFNGTRGLFGTNPMAYGIPGESEEIYCVDMATSEIPFFEFMASLNSGEPLREHSAIDQGGEFTTNAKAAIVPGSDPEDPISGIVPMGGGYKGYYLVYLLELLTSALIGMPSSPEMNPSFKAEEHGAILLAFSPKSMGTEQSFRATVKELHKALKAQTPKAGETIRIPGEENNKRLTASKDELEIDDELIKKLEALL